jgi:hypothetical protein
MLYDEPAAQPSSYTRIVSYYTYAGVQEKHLCLCCDNVPLAIIAARIRAALQRGVSAASIMQQYRAATVRATTTARLKLTCVCGMTNMLHVRFVAG